MVKGIFRMMGPHQRPDLGMTAPQMPTNGDSGDRPHHLRAGNQRHLPGGLGEARRAPSTSRTTTRACTAADLVPVPECSPLAQPLPCSSPTSLCSRLFPAVRNRVDPPRMFSSLLRTWVCSIPSLGNILAHHLFRKKSALHQQELALPGGEESR